LSINGGISSQERALSTAQIVTALQTALDSAFHAGSPERSRVVARFTEAIRT